MNNTASTVISGILYFLSVSENKIKKAYLRVGKDKLFKINYY
jgi:hypothetical protein